MRDDLITIVTGEPRSGTSMQMQSLHLLGVPVAGEKYLITDGKLNRSDAPKEFKKASKEHHNNMNPRGFYEIPGVVIHGTRDISPWKGKAIKVVTSGIWPRTEPNGMELGTPTELVDKYIFCTRHPRQIAVSQKDLSERNILGPSEDGKDWAMPKRGMSAGIFINRSGPALMWMNEQPQETLDKFISVDFNDMLSDPDSTLSRVMSHIEHSYTTDQMQAAVGNVKTTLNRSTTLKEWPDDMIEAGRVADQMYEAFRSLDRSLLASAVVAVKEYVINQRNENVTWVDDEDTWATVSPDTKRQILTNTNNLGTTLRTNLEEYRQNSLICDQCEDYSRDPEKTYTIPRPADLGPLVRPMVKCGRDNEYKTVEKCKVCWQQGSTVNGKLLPPQRAAHTISVR
jgi:hypothetical protein